jgi:hypothetical protein
MVSRRTLPMVLYLGKVSRDDAIAAMPKLKSGEDVVGNVNTHNNATEPCHKETLQIKNAKLKKIMGGNCPRGAIVLLPFIIIFLIFHFLSLN